jgi:hypothetical protein
VQTVQVRFQLIDGLRTRQCGVDQRLFQAELMDSGGNRHAFFLAEIDELQCIPWAIGEPLKTAMSFSAAISNKPSVSACVRIG